MGESLLVLERKNHKLTPSMATDPHGERLTLCLSWYRPGLSAGAGSDGQAANEKRITKINSSDCVGSVHRTPGSAKSVSRVQATKKKFQGSASAGVRNQKPGLLTN